MTGVRALAKVTMIALAGALEAQGAPDRVLSTARASHDSCATLAGGDLTPAVEKRRLEGWKDARRVSIGDWWIVLPTGATIDSTPRDTSEALVATELPYCEYCAVTVKLRRDSIGRGLDGIRGERDGFTTGGVRGARQDVECDYCSGDVFFFARSRQMALIMTATTDEDRRGYLRCHLAVTAKTFRWR